MTNQFLQLDKKFTAAAPPVDPRHKELVKQTQRWVSQTFFGTMLKQMRNSPFKSDILSGGRGGEAFNEMFDQQLAERMARSSGSKLVNAIVRKTEAAAAYRRQASPIDHTSSRLITARGTR